MKEDLKQAFLIMWEKYFNGAELPIVFYYTDEEEGVELAPSHSAERCLLAGLKKVRRGFPLRFDEDSIDCPGGKRYAGFTSSLNQNFEHFLSCGIPGVIEGERYKKSPELVRKVMEKMPKFKAPKKFILFKRWDMLGLSDEPEVVIFFVTADILSGLFTLANFDEEEENGVITPFGSGCSSIVTYPYLEKKAQNPRCVIGMFDPSARPHIPADFLSFAIPMRKFVCMIENMQESFLITKTWDKIRTRIICSEK